MPGFHEISFPDSISYGSAGGPSYRTQIVELDSGTEQRIARWSNPRHKYNVAYGIKSLSDLVAVKTFYFGRMGALNGFRFKDWLDFSTDATAIGSPLSTDVTLGVADGVTTVFQLFKPYTSGGVIRNRTITKPVGSTVRVALGYVEQFSGWSVNSTTGQITFSVAPTNGTVVQWGGQFEVPVRFTEDVDQLLNMSYDTYSDGSIDQLTLIEVPVSTPVGEEYWYGGAARYSISQSITISHLQGRVHAITPTAGGLSLTLPDMTNVPGGGPHFYIINESGVNALQLKYSSGTNLYSLPASTGKTLVYEKTSGLWYVL